MATTKTRTAARKVVPSISSGVTRMKHTILFGMAGLTTIYNVVYYLVKDSPMVIPAEEYCPQENPSCYRPDLFAFQMACFAALLYLGLTGFITWHSSSNISSNSSASSTAKRSIHVLVGGTPQERIFGYLRISERLAAVNLTFQVWNFAASLFCIEEHCTPILLAHHAVAIFVSWSSLESAYMHYYAIFFLGLSEFSSIFLVFVDLAKFFPPAPGSLFDAWVGICGPCFAVTFFAYRVVLWWKVLIRLWSDAAFVIGRGLTEKLRPGKNHVVYSLLAVSVPMGILQLYWFQIIVTEVVKVLNCRGA